MPVNLNAPSLDALHPVPGLRIGTTMAGIRKANRRDLVLFELAAGSVAAGVFTRNRFCAAPVQLCREHLALTAGAVRAMVVNTGNANANAGTGAGADGLARARRSCGAVAALLGRQPAEVLPFSTGVIMETLPVERLEAGLPAARADLAPAHWAQAAEGIMTTDTQPRAASRQVVICGRTVTVTSISQGAGMIRSNMATRFGFIDTDAVIDVSRTLSRPPYGSFHDRVVTDIGTVAVRPDQRKRPGVIRRRLPSCRPALPKAPSGDRAHGGFASLHGSLSGARTCAGVESCMGWQTVEQRRAKPIGESRDGNRGRLRFNHRRRRNASRSAE